MDILTSMITPIVPIIDDFNKKEQINGVKVSVSIFVFYKIYIVKLTRYT